MCSNISGLSPKPVQVHKRCSNVNGLSPAQSRRYNMCSNINVLSLNHVQGRNTCPNVSELSQQDLQGCNKCYNVNRLSPEGNCVGIHIQTLAGRLGVQTHSKINKINCFGIRGFVVSACLDLFCCYLTIVFVNHIISVICVQHRFPKF